MFICRRPGCIRKKPSGVSLYYIIVVVIHVASGDILSLLASIRGTFIYKYIYIYIRVYILFRVRPRFILPHDHHFEGNSNRHALRPDPCPCDRGTAPRRLFLGTRTGFVVFYWFFRSNDNLDSPEKSNAITGLALPFFESVNFKYKSAFLSFESLPFQINIAGKRL